jgi:hypothetical protein
MKRRSFDHEHDDDASDVVPRAIRNIVFHLVSPGRKITNLKRNRRLAIRIRRVYGTALGSETGTQLVFCKRSANQKTSCVPVSLPDSRIPGNYRAMREGHSRIEGKAYASV